MYSNGTAAANHARKWHRLPWDSPPQECLSLTKIEVCTKGGSGVFEGWWVGLADL